jgi:hypothetical protein
MDRQLASYVALLRGCASSPPRLGSALLALLAPHCEPRTERSALRQPATQSCHPRQEHCQLALAPLAKGQEVNSTWRLPCPHLPDRVLDKLPTAIGGLAPKVASIAIDCHVFMWRPWDVWHSLSPACRRQSGVLVSKVDRRLLLCYNSQQIFWRERSYPQKLPRYQSRDRA